MSGSLFKGRHSEDAASRASQERHLQFPPWSIICIGLLSALYFTNILLRASGKCFWVDELVTVYLCRLPDLHSITVANQHATDFNPPLFYILTRGAQHLFGEGLVSTRLPEILGLYFFCVGLYIFVARRIGHLAGCVAGLFPFFTLAQYYAYEARPHGLTLGWCGLALLFWQQQKTGTRNWMALAGFYACMTGAFLTHVYAVFIVVPFVIAEFYEWWQSKQIDWGMAAAITLALMTGAFFNLPLLRSYSHVAPQHDFTKIPWTVVQPFTKSLLDFGIVIILLVLALVGASIKAGDLPPKTWRMLPATEVVLALSFACLPILGIQAVRLTHGPFFYRYFLASLAGISILLGAACSLAARRFPRSPAYVAVFLVLALLYDTQAVVRHRMQHTTLGVTEPASGFVIGSPDAPLARDSALFTLPKREDVLVLQQLNEMYLFQYSPANLVPHLYLGALTADDPTLTAYERVATWAHVAVQTTTFKPFLATHSHFYAYGSLREDSALPPCGNCIQYFLTSGYKLLSVQRDADGLLFEYGK